ncbi:hsdR, partial [Escherichia coli]|nr:hsdR [Escherichia coli]
MFDDDDADHEPRPHELSPDVQALINNGLEFLDKAREELEASKAKFSVVSFWTAVEILLKVPLVHEHWSLVCSKKTTPKKQAYRNGDFQSITYEETRSLLRDVLEKPLPPDTHNAFEKVRKHRNRVVHFYHSAFTYADQEQIQKEQADAWFALNRFMRDQWLSIFDEPLTLKRALDEDGMLRNSLFYADAKFRYLKPELDGLKKQGCSVSA